MIFLTFLKNHILIVCIAIAVLLLLAVGFLIIQWNRVSKQKKHTQTADWSADAKRETERAVHLIKNGIVKGLCTEFGGTVPDSEALQKYITDAYGLRAGGLYIAVDSLSAFVYQMPTIFLQGSDNVGGESVLPLKINENGEPYLYLEGLSVCYRRDEYRSSIKYNIRFSLANGNRPIEEVLEFEVVQ